MSKSPLKIKLSRNRVTSRWDVQPEPKRARTVSIIRPPLNLLDFIKMINEYDTSNVDNYRPDIFIKLKNALPTLQKINEMIGIKDLKESILETIMTLLQDNGAEMVNICLYGAPGTGKTSICALISKLYFDLDILTKPAPVSTVTVDIPGYPPYPPPLVRQMGCSFIPPPIYDVNEHYIAGTRSNMIGGYLGQTSMKTQALIDRCVAEGKVLFLDEAYQFGSRENNDCFAKEMIDCVNLNLSRHGRKFICIIAGYENEINRHFFDQNIGLERRFPFKFWLKKYTIEDLYNIFKLKVQQAGFTIEVNPEISTCSTPPVEISDWFQKSDLSFPNQGGDIENLLLRSKIIYYRRIFGQPCTKILTLADIMEGYKRLNIKTEDKDEAWKSMMS